MERYPLDGSVLNVIRVEESTLARKHNLHTLVEMYEYNNDYIMVIIINGAQTSLPWLAKCAHVTGIVSIKMLCRRGFSRPSTLGHAPLFIIKGYIPHSTSVPGKCAGCDPILR